MRSKPYHKLVRWTTLSSGRLLKNCFRLRHRPSAAKAAADFCDLRRGWKPRPFNNTIRGEFFSKLLEITGMAGVAKS